MLKLDLALNRLNSFGYIDFSVWAYYNNKYKFDVRPIATSATSSINDAGLVNILDGDYADLWLEHLFGLVLKEY